MVGKEYGMIAGKEEIIKTVEMVMKGQMKDLKSKISRNQLKIKDKEAGKVED